MTGERRRAGAKPAGPFKVECPRFDGGTRLWASFSTRHAAEATAALLRRVGLHVVVRGPDDADHGTRQ